MEPRRNGSATRYPGVKRLADGRYHLRWKAENLKTGRVKECEKIVKCASLAEAARIRDKLRTATQAGAGQVERVRLSTFSTSWVAGKRKTLKPSTLDRYVRTLAHHIVPTLGDHYIDAITHQDIVLWRDAQTAKASTVNGWLRVLKTLFADATVAYDLPRDPSARVAALSETGTGYSDEQPNSLTAPQLALFLEVAQREVPRRWYPLFAVLAFTGMRVGEATALKWSDIVHETDDHDGFIRVSRAHWRGRVGTPKTGKRVRTVPMPKELAAILGDHRRALLARQEEKLTDKQLEGVLRGLEAGWVFPDNKGGPTAAQVVRKPLRQVLACLDTDESGIDHLTVHGLRRTMNNLLRQVTHGEVVRSVTGHVTERMTEHYSHVGVEEKSSAVAKVISLVRRPPTAGPTQVGVSVGVEAQKR